jgi:hypothetical protein
MANRPRTSPWWIAVALAVAMPLAVPPAVAGTVAHDDVVAAEKRALDAAGELAEAQAELAELEGTVAGLEARIDDLARRAADLSEAAADTGDSSRIRLARMYALAVVDPAERGLAEDVESQAVRRAYFEAVAGRDRRSLNALTIGGIDLALLRDELLDALEHVRQDLDDLRQRVAELAAAADAAQQEASALRSRWEEQEAARRAALEEEERRREEELANPPTTVPPTTSPPGTTPPTTTPPTTQPPNDYGYNPNAGVEQWRPLLSQVFARWGLDQEKCGPDGCLGPHIDDALVIMNCESSGVPWAVNYSSGTTGLFQHRPTFWADRVARVRSFPQFSDFPSDATPYNPEHNMVVAGMLIWESRETLIGNLDWGGPWDDGPQPFGHWDGSSRYCADPPLVWP